MLLMYPLVLLLGINSLLWKEATVLNWLDQAVGERLRELSVDADAALIIPGSRKARHHDHVLIHLIIRDNSASE